MHAECTNQIQGIQFGITNLLIKCVPIRNFTAVWHTHHQDGKSGLAEEHLPDQFIIRLDIAFWCHRSMTLPEFIPVDEEILVRGGFPLTQEILKLWRKYGGMIEDKVEFQCNTHMM